MTFHNDILGDFELEVGHSLKVVPGYLPGWYDGAWLPVVGFDSGYPLIHLYHETPNPRGGGVTVDQDETCAISVEIIQEVQPA